MLTAVDGWLASRRAYVIAAIVFLSLALRAVYFFELNAGPCIWQHRWDQTDMHYFDMWARQIVAGDWLSEHVRPPQFAWQIEVAEAYYHIHPEALQEARQAGEDPVRHIWTQWWGSKQFYQDPLYPYLIAATYKIFGPGVRRVFAWQMALGVLSNVLMYLIARRFFGETAGLVSGLLAVACAPLMYYELILKRETAIVFAGLLLVHVTAVALEKQRPRWWLLAGVVAGLAMLLKSHHAVFILGVAVAIVLRYRRNLRPMLAAAVPYALGVLVALTPLAVRNLRCGLAPLATAGGGGFTFIAANNPTYNGSGFKTNPVEVATLMARSDGRLLPAVVETLEEHASLGSYLQLLGQKMAWTWIWFEIPNNSNFYFYRLHAPVLRWLPVTFLAIAPLGVLGMVLAWPRFPTAWPLYLVTATNLIVLLGFFVISRFRLPLEAALIPFAAAGLIGLLRAVLAKQWFTATATAAAVLAGGMWVARPLPTQLPLIRDADYGAAYQTYYQPAVARAVKAGHWKTAADLYTRFFEFQSSGVRRVEEGLPPPQPVSPAVLRLYAEAHLGFARVLRQFERVDEAEQQERWGRQLLRSADERSS